MVLRSLLSRAGLLDPFLACLSNFYNHHKRICLVIFQLFFAFLAITGQVGQNVSLPLWAGAVSSNCSVHKSQDVTGEMDPYFILSFASISFTILFGFLTLVHLLIDHKAVTKEDVMFPQWQFILIGLCDALNGIFVVFASPAKRTAPFLQAILGNIMIPLTIVLRVAILRKKPTVLKVIAALSVLAGLILSLIPVIAGMDSDSKSGKEEYLSQSIASRILWPLCFMFGFVPAVLMNIFEEMSLKDSRKVNMFYLLMCTSFYQMLVIGLFFWVDIIPGFGYSPNLKTFGENYAFSFKCFFGYETCDYIPGLRGFMFIFMYLLSYIGSGLLLRYAEGATYLAVVQALVTPLGALFWSIFSQNACGDFFLHPNANNLTYFSIGGIVIIVPAILIYNIGTFKNMKRIFKGDWMKRSNSVHLDYDERETQPLLAN